MGRCASRGPAGGHFEIVAPRTYGDCVRDAMRASATRSVESCNSPVAGGGSDDPPEDDGEGDGGDGEGDDAEEPHPAPNPPPMTPNPALDEQNRREAETAVGEMVVGVVLMVGGAAVIFVGAAVAGGTLGGGTPVALGLGAAGLSLASMGLGIARGGIDRREGARRDWAERNGTTPPFLCPTMRSPAGFLSFAASRPGDGSGSSGRRMSVLDAMRACACENNPLDAILAGLPGPFGGNSCELGARLRCLREEDDDVATPMDPECARLLGEDNQESLSSQLQQCGIISCGTDSWVTPDCRCESMSGGGLGGGFDACEHVLCPEGTVPRPNGYSCACTPPDEHVGPSIPGVECIPGFPCAGGGGGTPPTPPFP
ncbi:hypothetical protein DB32_008299 [Sandaracinus amylolyticus]|uniref:Uncharacterized protein n=1 Tax=Sandaracinus amylolyticus TaxID=927083 RepID=A0A0F6W9V7_9BACT|nr:hypothetical protein DB32_008299 [Sandaracinus amylolyticus]